VDAARCACRGEEAADDYQDSGDECGSEPGAGRGAAGDDDPPGFSRVDLAAPAAQLRRRFPRFPGLDAAVEVQLHAGARRARRALRGAAVMRMRIHTLPYPLHVN